MYYCLDEEGGIVATDTDVAIAAEAIAVQAGQVWQLLDWPRRAEYERQARAALEALGVEVGEPLELRMRAAA